MSCIRFIVAQPPVCTHTGGGVVGHLPMNAQPLFLCSAGGRMSVAFNRAWHLGRELKRGGPRNSFEARPVFVKKWGTSS